MAKRLMVATLNISIPLDGGQLELTRGDEVDIDTLPTGTVESMARLGQLVERDAFEAMEEPAPAADQAEQPGDDRPPADPPAADWKQTPVDQIGLEPKVVEVLQANDLGTVEQVLVYGRDNQGLTSINGVGDATAQQIQLAIEKLMPKA